VAYWPAKVIAMQLANVGSAKGPAYDWISFIQNINPHTNVYAAGGVRDWSDIESLQMSGVSGVLVASALHSGAIEKEALKAL
jgi:phosphoribosylformimino-5-aminoimidazole carboxamide ribotide isomerase